MFLRPNLPPAGALALLYGRHSSTQQNPRSADDQNVLNEKCADQHDWVVAGKFKDEALSGRSTRKRTGYYELMAAVDAGQGQVVIVEDISRLGRDAVELQTMARRLDEAGVVLCTTSGEILAGMHLAIRAQMAEEYSLDLAYRVKRGHRSAAARGRVIGGVAYGYRMRSEIGENGERREKDPAEAAILLRIFTEYDAGVGTTAICGALNTEGVPPPSGQLWRPRTLTGDPHMESGFLRNPLYIGQVVFGRSQSKLIRSTGRVKVSAAPREDRICREVADLRIIEQDLWDRVQARLARSSAAVPNAVRRPTYLLSGLSVCGECQRPFSVVGGGMGCTGRRYASGCTNRRRVSREALEEAVLSGLKQRLLQPALLDLYLEEYRRELSKAAAEFNERHKGLESRKRELDQKVANLIAAIESGAAGEALELLTGKLKQIERDRRRLSAEIQASPGKPPESLETDDIIESLDGFLDELRSAMAGKERDAARAREIFRSFIDRIVVTPIDDGKADARGCGPVQVTVEGSITQLLGQSAGDRVVLGSGAKSATLGLPIVTFSYGVDIPWKNVNRRPELEEDVSFLRSMLDDAKAPISQNAVVAALASVSEDRPDLRAGRVIRFLRTMGEIRPVRFGVGYCGWVSNSREITNCEWRERAMRLPPSPSEPDADGAGLEGDLAQRMGAADPLDNPVGEHSVGGIEDHRVRRRGRVKPDRTKARPTGAELLSSRLTRGGGQE